MFESTPFSAETYFATQPAPPNLAQDIGNVQQFVARQAAANRNVVLVTSGGTTVPLELNVVRFLDNFSAGTRGATSAEYFLKAGYAVIFMHRQFSLQPFSRHYSHSTNPFLDFVTVEEDTDTACISAEQRANPDLLQVLRAYRSVQAAGSLHTLTFVTVNDYLWMLRAVSQELSILRRRAMYYLAAAVSDFFLPRQKMSEHKIQSGKGSLHIEMDQVPKVLKPMVEEWTRDGYIVSFKLETDPDLLIPKSRAALQRYGHQVVIGNDLHTRKHQVVFVSRKRKPLPPLPPGAEEAEAEAEAAAEPEVGEDKVAQPADMGSDGAAAETTVVPEAAAEADAAVDAAAAAPPLPPSKALDPPAPQDEEEDSLTFVETWLRISPDAPGKEIEEDIVQELVRRHAAWVEGG